MLEPPFLTKMGISKEVKDAIRALYPHTIRNCRSIKEFVKSIEPPVAPNFQFPTIVLFDYTAKLKYYPKDRVRNGHEYFENWFLPPIATAYEDGASVVYVCFDRGMFLLSSFKEPFVSNLLGSPINKDLEHKKRYRDTEFMEIPNFDGETIITDTYIPPPEEWEGFVNNKQLVGELIHYVTQRLLDEQADLEHTFSPPPGKVRFLFGQGWLTLIHILYLRFSTSMVDELLNRIDTSFQSFCLNPPSFTWSLPLKNANDWVELLI